MKLWLQSESQNCETLKIGNTKICLLNKSNLIWPSGTFSDSLMWYDFWLWQQEQHKKRDMQAYTVVWIHTLTIGGSATIDTVISSETVRRSAIIFWLALNAGSSKTGAPLSFKCVSSMPCPNLSPTICTQSLICNSCRKVCQNSFTKRLVFRT